MSSWVYISNLPSYFDTVEISTLFDRSGLRKEIKDIIIDGDSYQINLCAFVQFYSAKDAKRAAATLDGTVAADSRAISVAVVWNERDTLPTVEVARIPESVSVQQLSDMFEPFGDVIDIRFTASTISIAATSKPKRKTTHTETASDETPESRSSSSGDTGKRALVTFKRIEYAIDAANKMNGEIIGYECGSGGLSVRLVNPDARNLKWKRMTFDYMRCALPAPSRMPSVERHYSDASIDRGHARHGDRHGHGGGHGGHPEDHHYRPHRSHSSGGVRDAVRGGRRMTEDPRSMSRPRRYGASGAPPSDSRSSSKKRKPKRRGPTASRFREHGREAPRDFDAPHGERPGPDYRRLHHPRDEYTDISLVPEYTPHGHAYRRETHPMPGPYPPAPGFHSGSGPPSFTMRDGERSGPPTAPGTAASSASVSAELDASLRAAAMLAERRRLEAENQSFLFQAMHSMTAASGATTPEQQQQQLAAALSALQAAQYREYLEMSLAASGTSPAKSHSSHSLLTSPTKSGGASAATATGAIPYGVPPYGMSMAGAGPLSKPSGGVAVTVSSPPELSGIGVHGAVPSITKKLVRMGEDGGGLGDRFQGCEYLGPPSGRISSRVPKTIPTDGYAGAHYIPFATSSASGSSIGSSFGGRKLSSSGDEKSKSDSGVAKSAGDGPHDSRRMSSSSTGSSSKAGSGASTVASGLLLPQSDTHLTKSPGCIASSATMQATMEQILASMHAGVGASAPGSMPIPDFSHYAMPPTAAYSPYSLQSMFAAYSAPGVAMTPTQMAAAAMTSASAGMGGLSLGTAALGSTPSVHAASGHSSSVPMPPARSVASSHSSHLSTRSAGAAMSAKGARDLRFEIDEDTKKVDGDVYDDDESRAKLSSPTPSSRRDSLGSSILSSSLASSSACSAVSDAMSSVSRPRARRRLKPSLVQQSIDEAKTKAKRRRAAKADTTKGKKSGAHTPSDMTLKSAPVSKPPPLPQSTAPMVTAPATTAKQITKAMSGQTGMVTMDEYAEREKELIYQWLCTAYSEKRARQIASMFMCVPLTKRQTMLGNDTEFFKRARAFNSLLEGEVPSK
jgi:RNA recognition motif-containing protein